MLKSYRLGTLLGFPIEVNLSFLLLLGVVLLWAGGVTGLAIALIAFGSVLLHELGHALVARHLRVPVSGIELHFFGGAAKMGAPRSSGDEIAIAAAGPAVSFAIAGVATLLAAATGLGLLRLIAWINIIIGVFNLVPALPMDGGRIFRALMSRKFGFMHATEIAIKVSRGFAIALAVFGVFTLHIYLALLAAVLWWMGSAELRMARQFGTPYDGRSARWSSEPEVLPRGFAAAEPGAAGPVAFTGPWLSGGAFVLRRDGRRLVFELLDPDGRHGPSGPGR